MTKRRRSGTLRTIPLNFDPTMSAVQTMAVKGRYCALMLALALLNGCIPHTEPAELFTLTPDTPKHRAMQTRTFETHNEGELLSASAAVLQDLGFQIEESQRDVGFLRAT